MAKRIIRTGTTADPTGDSLKNAFTKVNDNFTELYNALGLDADTLNIGAFEFSGSTMTTTDSSAIVIDQATTVTSNLTVGGDILPQTANGGDLGSSTNPWRSLYVSNNTIYLGGTALRVNNNGTLTVGGKVATPTFTGNNGITANIDSNNNVSVGFGGILYIGSQSQYGFEEIIDGSGVVTTRLSISGETAEILTGNLDLTAWGSRMAVTVRNLNTVVDNIWTFGDDGNLTLPGNIRSENDISIEINSEDSTLRRWRFGEDGELTFPDGTSQSTAYTGSGITASSSDTFTNKTINIAFGQGNTFQIQGNSISSYSGSGAVVLLQSFPTLNAFNIGNGSNLTVDGGTGSYYWSGPTGVAQAGIDKAGVYRSSSSATDSLFTFAANGSGIMSAAVEGSLFVGSSRPSNNGGVTTAYGGWLLVENGGKFGADVDTLGNVIIGKGVFEKFQTKADATGTVEHDCLNGHIFYHTSPDANWTANFTNLNIATSYATNLSIVIVQGGTGYYPNAVQIGGVSQTINWQGNATPTPSTNRTDVVSFSIINNAGTYTVLGQLTGF